MRGLAPRVEFCALGPVGVIVDGQPVTLGSPKLRMVLAALLVEANSVVSSDRLVDILWGDDPPVSARATLQKLVYRLRLLVEPDRSADHLIVTRAPGYVLRVGPEEYDATRFEDAMRAARAQAANGAASAAAETLDVALGLWRGPAFAEFAYDDFARAEATRLEELRVSALEDRVDSKLALGHHEEVVGELERTVDAYPLRERSRAQLMLALYRAGRQVEALRAYQDHRRYLIDELGIEPSAALRSLEAAMVTQAPELDYEPSPIPDAKSPSGNGAASFPPPSVPVALAEAEVSRAFEDRITRAAATRIDLDLLEEEIADTVLDLHRQHSGIASDAGDGPAFARCPYKGLAYFESADADYFFGRERLVADLVARLAVEHFVGVVGVSGSGKSSLLLAGLCPALREGALPGSEQWYTVVLTPGAEPMERLARALAGGVPGLLLDLVRARLRDDPEALERIARDAPATKSPGARLVVIVDQFEELFTMCRDDAQRKQFVDVLTRPVADPRTSVSVILSVRADYYARCSALPELSALLGTTLGVGTMTERELRRVIESPAQRVGLELQPGLTDVILADVGDEPGALPLLSTALFETWVRRDDTTLTIAGYENAGGVSGALTHLAESVYARFSPDEQTACRRIFLRLAEPSEGDDDVRRRAPVAELVAPDDLDAATVLATLTERRLVTAGADGVEVAHEALLREWPRARTWLEDDREGRRLHHRLAVSAADWDAADRDPAELYRGARLASALDWSTAHPGEANQLERDFLGTASTLHDAELRTARRTARRLRALLVATAVFLVVAIAAGGLAIVQRGEARDQARIAEATRLATQAAGIPRDELDLALLLAIEARRLDRSDSTDGGLESTLAHVPSGLARLIPVAGGINNATLSPDGRRLVSASGDGKLRIIDVASGRIVHTLHVGRFAGAVNIAGFSPDGRLVIVASNMPAAGGAPQGTVRLFDARTGRRVGPALPAGSAFVYGQFSPGRPDLLVTVSPTELIRWDVSDPKAPRQIGSPLSLPENTNDGWQFTWLAMSQDGRMAATAAATTSDLRPHGQAFVWDLESGSRRLGPLAGRPATFTLDNTRLVLARPDRFAFVDATTGAEQRTLDVGFPSFRYAVSHDGSRLAVSESGLGHVRVYDLDSGQLIGRPLTLFPNAYPIAFLPGDRLLVASQRKAAVWRYLDDMPALATRLTGHTGSVHAQITSNGREIVTTGFDDHQVLLTSARDGQSLRRLLDPKTAPSAPVAVSTDGTTVAVPGAAGTVGLWDRDSRRLSVLNTSQTAPIHVAWSPTASVLAMTSGSGALELWDVSDPRSPTPRRVEVGDDVAAADLWSRHPVFSPDGRVVAVDDYPELGWLTLVDVASGRELRRIPLGPDIGRVAYSPDGKSIATVVYPWSTSSHRLVLVDAATGEVRGKARPFTRIGWAWAFVDGGRRIATVSIESVSQVGPSYLELWDATSLRPIGEPITLHGRNLDGAASAGAVLVTGTIGSGEAVLWDLDPGHWEKLACHIAGRNLTRAEWKQYLPEREYHRTCPS